MSDDDDDIIIIIRRGTTTVTVQSESMTADEVEALQEIAAKPADCDLSKLESYVLGRILAELLRRP